MTSGAMCHASVSVPGTEWVEPVLLLISIGMPTGSGKSSLYKYLLTLLRKARSRCETSNADHELLTFLSQTDLYKSQGLSDSHDLLQLYSGHSWERRTGELRILIAKRFAFIIYVFVVCIRFVCVCPHLIYLHLYCTFSNFCSESAS